MSNKLLALLPIFIVILSGCVSQQTSTVQQTTTTQTIANKQSSLTVSPQSLANNEVVVDSLYLDKPGYVVIHKDVDGKPGPVIGHSDLISGEKTNFKVTVDASQSGSRVFAMLHYDDNNNGNYDFPDEDKPVVLAGSVIVKQIAITQQTTTSTSSGQTKEFELTIDHSSGYSSNKISVIMGDKVRILATSNQPSHNHGITIDAYNINKAVLKQSFSDPEVIEFTADKAGTFEIYCKTCFDGPLGAHPWLKGTLEVK